MATMKTKLDSKFHGIIVKNKDHTIVPQDQWVCFLAKDDAFPATLRFYRKECERIGAASAQLTAVDDLIARLDAWRAEYPDACKTPDVLPGEIIV
jgi:hypothetical protein